MTLTFRLRFRTKSGQSLLLSGHHPSLGNGLSEAAVPLQYVDTENWSATIVSDTPVADFEGVNYHYLLREANGSVVHDGERGKVMDRRDLAHEQLLIVDSWNYAGFFESAFYTEPFQQVLLRSSRTEVHVPAPDRPTHTFKVKAPLLAKGQTLCLLGDSAALGSWNTARPLVLNRSVREDFLSVQLDLGKQSFPIAYKYGVYDIENRTFVRFEEGPNRILNDAVGRDKYTVVNDGFVRLPADTWRGAGVAIPVFSLRSENSFGVGEFEDLKRLSDWGRQVGLKLIQILPVNDTSATHTWRDSYPYAAISAFALHPLFLNLKGVVAPENRHLLAQLEPERKRLNALPAVDYEAVMKAKLGLIERIFPSQKKATFASEEYQGFFDRNQHWLIPYAAFCCLRDRYRTSDFSQWPAYQRYRPEEIAELSRGDNPGRDQIELNYFIQYHLHVQLKDATDHAHAQGLIVKGDIPIGVYRHGADAWQQPGLYHMEAQAGAPPDAFAVKGQNWGFPTYNWPRMREDGFAWWKQRLEQMSFYFDAFRIDHILGFFRIWSIPLHAVEGILGYFEPALPVRLDEFAGRGIKFDRQRFTRPYITGPILDEIFKEEAQWVRQEFLVTDSHGNLSLKPAFATQRQVERHFSGLADDARHQKIKLGLYDLISNVILFEVEGSQGQQFHFRFGIDQTSSFKNLEPGARSQLSELYVDYFFRRQDEFWMKEAMEKLPALKHVTNMLVCGEDLGLVPACVPDVMKQLGLLSLEIQRMPKKMNQQFFRPAEAPYLSVVTPSTHDMSTIRGWWGEDRNTIQGFFNHELGRPGDAPPQCETWINLAIIVQHLNSPAMWSIFQLQDLLGISDRLRRADFAAERINVPANPENYWRYRMHLTLEELQAANDFNESIRNAVQQSGRV